jgi:hypothetical protein
VIYRFEDAELNCRTVDVGGPEAVTLRRLMPWLSRVFRRPLSYREIPLRKLKRSLGEHGLQLIAHINRNGYRADMTPLLPRMHPPLADLQSFLLEAWRRAGLEVEPLATAQGSVRHMDASRRHAALARGEAESQAEAA